MQSRVFQQVSIREVPYKISAMDFYQHSDKIQTLYVGDASGNLYKYPIREDEILQNLIPDTYKDSPINLGTKK